MYYVEIVNGWGDSLGKEQRSTLTEAHQLAATLTSMLEPGESVRITQGDE